jgi:hypothetical protein
MREQTIQKGIKKVLKTIERMENTRSIDDILENVKITNKLILEINCFREENEKSEYYGEPHMYEIYAIKEDNPVDCATISDVRKVESEVMYLLNCYV